MNPDFIRFFIVLLFAHLLGDFALQFAWIQQRKKKWTGRLLHCVIHAALAYVLLGAWTLWLVPLIVGGTHYLIDWGKSGLREKRWWVFVLDQILHGSVLIGLAAYGVSRSAALPLWLAWQPDLAWKFLVLACALLLLVPCGGYLIGALMAPYQAQLERRYTKQSKTASGEMKKPVKGLEEGGRIIGYLERLLILVFVLSNQYAGIGFLVAAKSIFRFGEFKESENRMEAEYIIIGTFASFLYAVVVSQAVQWLLGQ